MIPSLLFVVFNNNSNNNDNDNILLLLLLGKWRNQQVAVKQIQLDNHFSNNVKQQLLKDFLGEAELMRYRDDIFIHPSIHNPITT